MKTTCKLCGGVGGTHLFGCSQRLRAKASRPSTEPVLKEIRKARRAHAQTPVGQLEKLLVEQTKWKRRATIAANKLGWIRQRIEEMALAHALQLSGKDKQNDKDTSQTD